MRTILPLLGLAFLARAGDAQGPVDPGPINQSVREVVATMKAAAEHKDWKTLQSYFPPNTPWIAQVERLVTGPQGGSTVSFWEAASRAELDRLVIQLVASDIAAIQLPFTVKGTTGMWGAVLIHSGEGWRLHCTIEAFGSEVRAQPGCFLPRT